MRRLVIAAAFGLLLAGCATQTPYQPSSTPNSSGYGFSEQAVESNRVRITFSGNSLTNRETVETYLLYRAAEVTLQRGFDYFTVADRATQSHSRLQADGPAFGYGGFFPYNYHYYSPRFGWSPWYDPFWDEPVNYREVTRYEATAEITMARGRKPANASNAYDAREVQANLAGRIVRPPAPAAH